MTSKAQKIIDEMMKNGTVAAEFPEIANSGITAIRPGDETDPETVYELVEMGWPIMVVVAGGVEHYALPKSFRDRANAENMTISTVN